MFKKKVIDFIQEFIKIKREFSFLFRKKEWRV